MSTCSMFIWKYCKDKLLLVPMSAAMAAFVHIWIPQDEGKAHLQLLQLGSTVQISAMLKVQTG